MERRLNTKTNKPEKITWQELDDQGYTPINHIMKPSFDWSSIPADKLAIATTVLEAEKIAVDIEQEAEADKQRTTQEEDNKRALERLQSVAKSSGEIATKQFVAAAEAETAKTVSTLNGMLLTDSEKAEILAGDRDTR